MFLFPRKEIRAFHRDDCYAHGWEGEVHPIDERYRGACLNWYDLLGLIQSVGYIEYTRNWGQCWRVELSSSNDAGSGEIEEYVGHKVRSTSVGNLEDMLYVGVMFTNR